MSLSNSLAAGLLFTKVVKDPVIITLGNQQPLPIAQLSVLSPRQAAGRLLMNVVML